MSTPPRHLPRQAQRGTTLLLVMVVTALLTVAFGTYMGTLSQYRRVEEQRVLNDRAFMAAEAGLASEIVRLTKLATPPAASASRTVTFTGQDYSPFMVTAAVNVQNKNAQGYWTVSSTAVADPAQTRGQAFSRRVQATLMQENFSKYEMFTNDFGGVWSPGYLQFIGLGTVFMGPVNINSGAAIFPNFWSMSEVTTAAPKGVRQFANFNDYVNGVYNKGDAADYLNLLNYWNSTYGQAPQFYGGLRILPEAIALPQDMNNDSRAEKLRSSAGLTLPDGYAGYVASAGPNFVIDLTSTGNGNGTITIRQYLGKVGGNPSYGSPKTTTVNAVNGAMVVKGNVVSLKGTLDGRLTVGVFKDAAHPEAGNVGVTGDLQYESRVSQTNFKFTDAPEVFTADGSGVNKAYIDTLQHQLDTVNDMLGIVSEGDVLIKEKDLAGQPIASNPSVPMHVDAVVMATGTSTATVSSGGFGVENYLNRPPGKAYFLGGIIQNKSLSYCLVDNKGKVTNGIDVTQLWDQRSAQAGGAPPFFPSTGNFQVMANSWSTTYVSGASAAVTLPVLP